MKSVSIRPIHSEKDYLRTLARIDSLWGAKKRTPEGDEFEILVALVEAYEELHYSVSPPTPIEAIKYQMEELDLSNADLAKYLGSRSRVSEILSGKRKLTVKMMKVLHKELGVPAEVLLS